MKSALFCASNSWFSECRVGSHHLAKGLSDRGWNVVYISDPISPAHIFRGVTQELRDRFGMWASCGRPVVDNIFSWVPGAFLSPYNAPILRSKFVLRNWHRLSFPSIASILKRNGYSSFDFLYIDSLYQAFWWESVDAKMKLFRMCDDYAGFSRHTRATQDALEYICKSVDRVAYSSLKLRNVAEGLSSGKAFYLPNGVDYQYFSIPAALPQEYLSDPRPKVVYVGAIADWFNFEWVRAAALALPQAQFVLIGTCRCRPEASFFPENIVFLGARPYEELPGYLQHAAVGIIPFDHVRCARLVNAINPLKLYEYLAAGLPVVSSRWDSLASLGSPALLANTEHEFCAFVARALKMQESEKLVGQRYAKQFSWNISVNCLLDNVG